MESCTSMVLRKNIIVINFAQSQGLIDFSRSILEIQILLIPNISQGKSYEHGYMKKYDDNKLCVKSWFDRFIHTPC
ncbi:hypothetical protein BHM03_00019286 [Ensete ventricosum]|nr:hypothetical protein BHM03_00019286 [Ensete ventricosum]